MKPAARFALPAVLAVTIPVLAAPPPVMPFSEVRPGMKGIGKTVFEGTRVDTFQVEILGKLPNIAPDQNLILARCAGGPLAETGIMAGMSGSPVWIDGKLIGAIAYSWGFTKEPIAGITPIEEMLAVGKRDAGTGGARKGAAGRPAIARLGRPDSLAAFFENDLPGRLPRPAASLTPTLPLSVSGLGASGLDRIAPTLRRAGFLPMQSGSAGDAASPAPPLEPGSAVGVKLVRGDVDMTATGTVTWVDGTDLYAFGHPLYGLGDVDLPLTAARVEALLPSLESSSKIAVPLEETGAFRQDRATAIFGKLGAKPRMVPVRLQLADATGRRRAYAFDVVSDPLLTPLLLYSALNGVLESNERIYGAMTLRLREGSVIKIEGQDDVEVDNLFAGDTAPQYATGLSAYILYLLMNNEWRTPVITGVNLIVEHQPDPRSATIRRVTLDRYRVKAGDTVTATVVVSPYRGADLVFTRSIEIPHETPPGRLLIQVGDAGAVSRAESADDAVVPRDLDQLVRLINRLRRNDRVYIVAARADNGVMLAGARLPNLPPSAASILSRPRSVGNYALVPQRGILEEEIRTEYAIDGFARVQLEVEDP